MSEHNPQTTEETTEKPSSPLHLGLALSPIPKGSASRSLENKLLTRITRQELVDKNILFGDSAPSLHGAARALDRRQRGDVLAGKLKARPAHDSLVSANIIRSGGLADPESQKAQDKQKMEIQQQLGQKIQARPHIDSLAAQNILPTTKTEGTAETNPSV
eukprot:TRINITY_DN3742_c0_g1_i2.p1 TRINITY_DN3742_c0_g1~~TRINITY_DN3742_c0_g1_i2.p1  ORF type:complete len:160 (-),score=10.28 TRINITY_DN3742_c0_g1_i2:42-521(-)